MARARSATSRTATVLLAVALTAASSAPATAAPPGGRTPPGQQEVTLFPSDELTVPDRAQLTGRRVALQLPDCAVFVSDCNEIRLINQLDGFDLDPRVEIGVPKGTDPIAVAAATTITEVGASRRGRPDPIGVERVVFDAASSTVYAHPQRQLDPGTTYRLELKQTGRGHLPVTRTTFTTSSATTGLQQLRDQLDTGDAFEAAGIDDRSLRVELDVPARGTALAYAADLGALVAPPVPVPNASGDGGRYVFGSYLAPSWLRSPSEPVIEAAPTAGEGPQVTRQQRLPFVLVVPPGEAPDGGWPVAVFGHGFTASDTTVFLAAGQNARQGIATIATDVVGHGSGPRSRWLVTPAGAATQTVPAYARGVDANGDGVIGSTEGVSAPLQPHPDAAIANRDGLRQTVADVMTLVRAVGLGVDFDDDGDDDLRRTDVGYFGQSFGGIYGTMLGGVDPLVPVVVPNVPGGPINEIARLSPGFRPLVTQSLALRRPQLLNGGANGGFTESMPLRGEPPVLSPAPGAVAIQDAFARGDWVNRSGSPETFAPLLRAEPPPGQAPKQVLVQVTFGDQTVPNPTSSTLVAAGELFDRTSLYRNDLTPQRTQNPHTFLLNPAFPQGFGPGQRQVATFLASGGATTIDPDGAGPVWETPIADPDVLLRLNFPSP